ncbi:hypothetical protein SPSYN_01391 [Sporotomaculum syntrophicum]|uniref:Uncharacterized protein n=1 Tax=Sporotomaculum syntrophicum TaxID=182264 RepID=A0A9D3AWC6_9FIRM|nr:hypothetical protein SPSYN_01391 [Sporotomaculum syntrophicum]
MSQNLKYFRLNYVAALMVSWDDAALGDDFCNGNSKHSKFLF